MLKALVLCPRLNISAFKCIILHENAATAFKCIT